MQCVHNSHYIWTSARVKGVRTGYTLRETNNYCTTDGYKVLLTSSKVSFPQTTTKHVCTRGNHLIRLVALATKYATTKRMFIQYGGTTGLALWNFIVCVCGSFLIWCCTTTLYLSRCHRICRTINRRFTIMM